MMKGLNCLLTLSFLVVPSVAAFSCNNAVGYSKILQQKHTTFNGIRKESRNIILAKDPKLEEEVEVGSKEYYSGFLNRGFDEKEERVTGDKVLIPTLKFVGGFTVIIGALLVVFMASNGLL